MKKIVFVSDESIVSGRVKCGVAELVDSLANAVSGEYKAYVICPYGSGVFLRWANHLAHKDGYDSFAVLGVEYYVVRNDCDFGEKMAEIVADISPDIFHNFADPALITLLKYKPAKTIYTIDIPRIVRENVPALESYDHINADSEYYANELRGADDDLSKMLQRKDFRGITCGVMTTVFDPQKGLFLTAKYSPALQGGKTICKKRLCQTYGLPEDRAIFLSMGRLVKEKGLDAILESIGTIKNAGGFLLIVGSGDPFYEKRLRNLKRSDGAIWVNRWASPIQAIPMMAGADFFMSPSTEECCGLMPMQASCYGAIPIVTEVGGLRENFDAHNAIIVGDNGMVDAINSAMEIYRSQRKMAQFRANVMRSDFSWNTRKKGYIQMYEA